jgi:hypothetical protein
MVVPKHPQKILPGKERVQVQGVIDPPGKRCLLYRRSRHLYTRLKDKIDFLLFLLLRSGCLLETLTGIAQPVHAIDMNPLQISHYSRCVICALSSI